MLEEIEVLDVVGATVVVGAAVLELDELDVLELVVVVEAASTSPAGPQPFHAGPHGTAPASPAVTSTRATAVRI